MKPSRISFVAALLLGLTACTTMGTGVGSSPTGNVRAILTWKGGDRTGIMTAMLSTGETYSGMYF
ncbi:MAG TPA: hypothetical protein VK479_15565, partial [Micropepsaceae bacterium]|nr:hypothetical protein [Micropepsaceae bacterium]